MQTHSFHCHVIGKEVRVSTPIGEKPTKWQLSFAKNLSRQEQSSCPYLGLGCQCLLAELTQKKSSELAEVFL